MHHLKKKFEGGGVCPQTPIAPARSFVVRMCISKISKFSDTKPITHDVPQGSIIGPIWFIINIDDFSRASEKLFSILYADMIYSTAQCHCPLTRRPKPARALIVNIYSAQ